MSVICIHLIIVVVLIDVRSTDFQSKALQAKQSDSAVISSLQQKVSNLQSRLEQASNYNNVDIDKLTRSLRITEQELHESKTQAKKLEEKLNSSRQEVTFMFK